MYTRNSCQLCGSDLLRRTYLVTEYLFLSVRLSVMLFSLPILFVIFTGLISPSKDIVFFFGSTDVLLSFSFLFCFVFFVWALRCGQCWLLLCFFFIKKILIWFSSPNISASVCLDIWLWEDKEHPQSRLHSKFSERVSLAGFFFCRAELHSRLSHFRCYFWLSPHPPRSP